MSEPLQDSAVTPPPEELHTDAELTALADEMPSVPETLEVKDVAPSWPREVIDPGIAQDVEEAGVAGQSSDRAAALVVPPVESTVLNSLQAASTATVVRPVVASSGIRTGGTVVNPRTGRVVRWTPIEPVADEYDAAKALASKGFVCLGVIGNGSHLLGSGGHTPWDSEGYAGIACKPGKVYAIDLELPNMTGFERWFVAKMRANVYKWVYYFNINGHQYTRVDSFRGRYSSADYHLHLSGLAGHENDNSTILRDWQAYRTSGGDDMASVPQAQWDRARAQLDAISDTVTGGKGSAYTGSVMRRDHGFQIEEIDRRVQAYIDQRLATIESKLDALIAATGGTTTTTTPGTTTTPTS